MFCGARPHVFFLHVCTIFVLLFVPIQLWFLPEYHANFAITKAKLPNTQEDLLDASNQKKLGITIKYPYMHFVGSNLNDVNDHNMARMRHARGGLVSNELTFNVNDFYTIGKDSGTSNNNMCERLAKFTFKWSNHWNLFVPGCAKPDSFLEIAKAGAWNLQDIPDADTKKVNACYKSARSYSRNAMVQKIVWAIAVVVYAILLASNSASMQKTSLSIILGSFLVFMICQGLQYNFLSEVNKDDCFGDRIGKVLKHAEIKYGDGTNIDQFTWFPKAYDWRGKNNLRRYIQGKLFTGGDVFAFPDIHEKDVSKIGTFTPNVAILWTNIGLSIVGVILIVFGLAIPG